MSTSRRQPERFARSTEFNSLLVHDVWQEQPSGASASGVSREGLTGMSSWSPSNRWCSSSMGDARRSTPAHRLLVGNIGDENHSASKAVRRRIGEDEHQVIQLHYEGAQHWMNSMMHDDEEFGHMATDARKKSTKKRAAKKGTLADELRDLIRKAEKRGITRYKIAKVSGLSESTLSKFMSGDGVPRLDTAQRIVEAIGGRIRIDT